MNQVIQIAGVIDYAEASMLLEADVNFLGFPLRLPDGREDLSETQAREIIRLIGNRVHTVLITYLSKASEIAELSDYLGVNWVQLHGEISLAELEKLRSRSPGLSIIKSLVVHGDNLSELLSLVTCVSELVDAFITDTFDPRTGRRGATGKIHDWRISREIAEVSPKPVILAGGLTPTNVREAIFQVKPAGVDCHTGVEAPDGRKEPELVHRFVAEAREGFRPVSQGVV